MVTGRRAAPLAALAEKIGAVAEEVDVLDAEAVSRVVARHDGIDISFNAMGIGQEGIQGTPLTDLPLEKFQAPIHAYLTGHFLTARAAARVMAQRGEGVVITLTANPAATATPLVGGMGPAWAGVEALTRVLAAELGPQGVRAMCLRADGIPETATIDTVFGLHARARNLSTADFTAGMRALTLNHRLPTLAEVAAAAVYLASDESAVLTGATLDVSGGRLG